MGAKEVTRRAFLSTVAIASAVASMGCPRRNPVKNGVVVFKRAGRKIHVSNAAKKNNANKLYRTRAAALQDKAHKGDKSYVVQLTINKKEFDKLFAGGRQVADLRHDL